MCILACVCSLFYSKTGVEGSVQMNDIKFGSKKYTNYCSYILQDDNLYPSFTVQETMLLAANLKIADLSLDEKCIIVSSRTLYCNFYWS